MVKRYLASLPLLTAAASILLMKKSTALATLSSSAVFAWTPLGRITTSGPTLGGTSQVVTATLRRVKQHSFRERLKHEEEHEARHSLDRLSRIKPKLASFQHKLHV